MTDDHQFQSIEGWIELAAYSEAAEELHNLPPALTSSVEFCRLWVRIYTATKKWSSVDVMSETLLKHAPDDHFAIAIRQRRSTSRAAAEKHSAHINTRRSNSKPERIIFTCLRVICARLIRNNSLQHASAMPLITTMPTAISPMPSVR
jgi:hypothetical protein